MRFLDWYYKVFKILHSFLLILFFLDRINSSVIVQIPFSVLNFAYICS